MSIKRLSQNEKDKIVFHLISAAFGKKEDALKHEFFDMAKKIHHHVYPKKQRDLMNYVESLYPGSFAINQVIVVSVDGGWVEHFHGPLNTRLLFEHVYAMQNKAFVRLGENTNLGEAVVDLIERRKKLASGKSSARAKARAALSSPISLAKLIKMWPEVEPYTAFLEQSKPSTSLALPTADLNKLFGLPKKEEK